MSKFIYPAIFTREDNGQYSVDFPDVPHCYTGGDDLDDAVVMAEDVLALTLSTLEDNGGTVPTISPVARHLNENQSIKLIACDTDDYRKRLAAHR